MESGNKKTEWENSLENNAKNYATEWQEKCEDILMHSMIKVVLWNNQVKDLEDKKEGILKMVAKKDERFCS